MKQKKRTNFFGYKTGCWGMIVIAIVIIFPSCSTLYVSPKKKTPTETTTEKIPSSSPKSQRIPSKKIPHKIEEYNIKSPSGKEIPRIGAKTDNRHSNETSYMLAGVVNLMDKAKEQMALENFDHAFATAERALRIDDANPLIWNLLAEIQLKRGNMVQAEQLAYKSNLLAKKDNILQAKNWRIIAETLYRRGKRTDADHAIRKAKQLEKSN